MTVRNGFILTGVFALLLADVGLAMERGTDGLPERPNILFIIVDDLNDYVGRYGGHPQSITPSIDKLAASGVTFTNAHTNSPVCQPARNSLFTGVYPHDSRDFGWTARKRHVVLRHNKTFLHLLRENGYSLHGTGKLLHRNDRSLWDDWGVPERYNYGPHAFDGKQVVPHPDVPEPFRNINIVDGSFAPLSQTPRFPVASDGRQGGWSYSYDPDDVYRYVSDDDRDLMPDELHADWAVRKLQELEQAAATEPFFLGIGFVKPHTPLYAPDKYFDMYPLDDVSLPARDNDFRDNTFFHDNYPRTQMGLRYYDALCESYDDCDEGLRLVVQAYLACVTFMDDQVGRVIDALNDSKFADNTLVILTSDHGWQFGEREYLYKNSPWEESTRVPLIVRAPGEQVTGMEVDQPVSLVDLFPTIQDYAHLQGSTKFDEPAASPGGFSIRNLVAEENATWSGPDGALTVMGVGISEPIEGLARSTNPTALWHVEVLKHLGPEYVMQQTYSYRTARYRYIRYRDGSEELYDHQSDPREWRNVASDEAYIQAKRALKDQMMGIIEGRGN